MVQMLRKESRRGEIEDLAHVRTEDCLSDCLTKQNIKKDSLIKAVEAGVLNNVDTHPSLRELLKHRAYFMDWISVHVPHAAFAACLMGATLDQLHHEQSQYNQVVETHEQNTEVDDLE